MFYLYAGFQVVSMSLATLKQAVLHIHYTDIQFVEEENSISLKHRQVVSITALPPGPLSVISFICFDFYTIKLLWRE